MPDIKTIFLLIGPKGSGKSHIGTLFERDFKIPFLRVENWVREMGNRSNISDEAYVRKSFEIIEAGVRNKLAELDTLVFESTGLSQYFDLMLYRLKRDFNVIIIGVEADPELCSDRVKNRDQSIHINVPDDQIEWINKEVVKKKINTNFRIENSNKTDKDLIREIDKILMTFKSGKPAL